MTDQVLCALCLRRGWRVEAVAFDEWWGLSVCDSCESDIKHSRETGALLPGSDVNGNPIDSNHLWNH